MLLFIDTETIPSQIPGALELVRQSVKPPATYKKPESIAAWLATEGQAAAEEAYRRQSLDGGIDGELASVAVIGDDDAGWVRCRKPGESEAELLLQFVAEVQRRLDLGAVRSHDGTVAWPDEVYPVAHNASFDIGFIWRRCKVHRIALPFKWPGPLARIERDFGDTMALWSGVRDRVSLDNLCRALGVPSPKAGGFDGSQVLDAWLAGQADKIAEYNLADARACRDIWHILTATTV